MLVLTRKQSESIDVPEIGMRIHIFEVRGGNVKVGFEAPDDVRIIRSEVFAPETTAAPVAAEPEELVAV